MMFHQKENIERSYTFFLMELLELKSIITHTRKKNITRGTQQKILAAEERIGTLKYRSIETTQSENGKKE